MNLQTCVGAAALVLLSASAAFAVPMCDPVNANGRESATSLQMEIQSYEGELRAQGIIAHNTRFWNHCLQTFVVENGKDVMKFYDPNTMREIPKD